VIQPVPPVANYASHPWAGFIGRSAFFARDMVENIKRELGKLRSDRAKPDQKRGGEDSSE
jgi:hypothetical protein